MTFDEGSALTQFGNYCFDGCISLTSIDLPETVTFLGQYTFRGCGLVEIDLSALTGLTRIASTATTTSVTSKHLYLCGLQVPDPGGAARRSDADRRLCLRRLRKSVLHQSGQRGEIRKPRVYGHGAHLREPVGQPQLDGLSRVCGLPVSGKRQRAFQLRGVLVGRRGAVQRGRGDRLLPRGQGSGGRRPHAGRGGRHRRQRLAGCNQIEEVIIPEGITEIGQYAFYDSSIKRITIPASVTHLRTYAFAYSDISEIVIPATVTNIYSHLFDGSALQTATVEATAALASSTAQYLFANCELLTSVTFAEGTESIPSYAFLNCLALESIALPSTVTTIGGSAFSGSGLKTSRSGREQRTSWAETSNGSALPRLREPGSSPSASRSPS